MQHNRFFDDIDKPIVRAFKFAESIYEDLDGGPSLEDRWESIHSVVDGRIYVKPATINKDTVREYVQCAKVSFPNLPKKAVILFAFMVMTIHSIQAKSKPQAINKSIILNVNDPDSKYGTKLSLYYTFRLCGIPTTGTFEEGTIKPYTVDYIEEMWKDKFMFIDLEHITSARLRDEIYTAIAKNKTDFYYKKIPCVIFDNPLNKRDPLLGSYFLEFNI